MLHNVLGATHHNRGNAISLEMPGDQAGGLVANRTVRDQYRGIPARTVAAAMVAATRSVRRGPQRYTYAGIKALAGRRGS